MRKKNCFVSAIIALVMCFCVMYSFCTIVVKADIKLNNKKGSPSLSKIRLLFIPRCVKIYKNIISRG